MTVLPGTYQLKTTFHNIDALIKQNLVSLTIWGVPTEAAHDDWRWDVAPLVNLVRPRVTRGSLIWRALPLVRVKRSRRSLKVFLGRNLTLSRPKQ